MIRNIVGTPARGEDFYNREELISIIWDRLETGNILLAAPRRFGKTSVMYALIDKPKSGWKPVHVDAESIREPVNFIIALLDALLTDRQIRQFLVSSWKTASNWIRGTIEDLELITPWDVSMKIKLKQRIQANWQDHGEDLLKTLRSYDREMNPLIIIDELPVMLQLFRENNVMESDIRAFLYWFRKLRTDPAIGLTNCRFLVGGSIGIEHYLSQLNAMATFNDFERMALNELGPKKAAEFLEKLLESRRISLSPTTQKKILDLIGAPIPYFIQVFVAEIASELVNRPGPVGLKRLGDIYQQRVLGATCKSYFEHYYTRLRQYDKPAENAAKDILKELALAHPQSLANDNLYAIYNRASNEIASKEHFAWLISDLENDFYIRYQPEKGYQFASKILCDWWRRYYAF
jgi:AAA+ ATPase superfamily predicted ATPase